MMLRGEEPLPALGISKHENILLRYEAENAEWTLGNLAFIDRSDALVKQRQ
jgi:hypothetical protein